MKEKYTIKDAKQFSEEFENIQSLNEIDYLKFAKSLKIFAELDENVYFKRTLNKYIELEEIYRTGIIEKNPEGKVEIKKQNYSFLEFLCSSVDSIYTTNFFYNLVKRLTKEGKTTKMFKNNYTAMDDLQDLGELE